MYRTAKFFFLFCPVLWVVLSWSSPVPVYSGLDMRLMAVPADEEVFDDQDIILVEHPAYIAAMHQEYNIPAWVSHTLSSEKLEKADRLRLNRKKNAPSGYPKDPGYTRLKSNLYGSTGYDHGHLAPAADFGYNKTYYKECFYMTNMAPQHGCMNEKGWCYLESQCRTWAREHAGSTLYLVTGPVLRPYEGQPVFCDTLCIKQGLRVYVPSWYFKAVFIHNSQTGESEAIGFVVPNADVANADIEQMSLSIDRLEKITGIDFFSELPDEVEKKAEKKIAGLHFNGQSDCHDGKSCEDVYSSRISPQARTKCRCRP